MTIAKLRIFKLIAHVPFIQFSLSVFFSQSTFRLALLTKVSKRLTDQSEQRNLYSSRPDWTVKRLETFIESNGQKSIFDIIYSYMSIYLYVYGL